MTKTRIVESEQVERDYGFKGTQMIIDHPNRGRLMLCDGFGGMDSLDGGAVRWRHGMAVQLRTGDTFESLRAEIKEAFEHPGQHLGPLFSGVMDGREVLPWSGSAIEAMAEAVS